MAGVVVLPTVAVIVVASLASTGVVVAPLVIVGVLTTATLVPLAPPLRLAVLLVVFVSVVEVVVTVAVGAKAADGARKLMLFVTVWPLGMLVRTGKVTVPIPPAYVYVPPLVM